MNSDIIELDNQLRPTYNNIALSQSNMMQLKKDKSAFCVSQYFKTKYQTIIFRNKIYK